jgi:predicted ATP-grasp superfamily ATP-dependent carboligase
MTPTPGRVLVTDGEFKHSLGIVRALGARGHEVHLLAQSARAPAVHSRAVSRWHPAPPPRDATYAERLLEAAAALAPVSLLPVSDASNAAAQGLRERFGAAGVRVALPPRESFEIACDKTRTAEIARAAGLATPRERVLDRLDDARAAFGELGAPLVVKSRREMGRKMIRYVRRAEELAAAFEEIRALSGTAPLAQEYVTGEGFGFSALYWEGRCLRQLMHRRVREWPPSGGTSACAESIVDQPELERAGRALLDALRWHGVAMTEFKWCPHRLAFVVMEINAKFWGSHDVALAASVDFPGDLAALLEGRELPPQAPPRRVRFSWPFGGDLWHGLARPAALPRVLWDAVSPWVAHSYRPSDPLPLLYEMLQWARSAPGAWRELRETRR